MHHPIVSREDLQILAVLNSLERHRPIIISFYPVLDKFGDWNSFGRVTALSSRIPVRSTQGAESTSKFLHSHKNINCSLRVKCWCEFFHVIYHRAQAKFLPFCSRSQWSEHVDFRSFSLRRMSKCFIQIGVQKPTTINAFTEAQKFIIISVISKGFSSCLASEFEGFLRTWAKLVTTSNIYLHIKSPLRVPNVFPLSGDSLWL